MSMQKQTMAHTVQKRQIICLILDSAKLKDKVCYSQELNLCFRESLTKDKKNVSY